MEKGRPPTKMERAEHRETVVMKIRKRVFPSTRTADVSLNLGTGLLLIWSASRQMGDELVEVLEHCLDTRLVEMNALEAAAPLPGTASLFGRQWLTWLHSRSEDEKSVLPGTSVTFVDKITLRATDGEAREVVASNGVAAPYAAVVKGALTKGMLVHSARIEISHGERHYAVTLDAEHLDFRAGRLPALMTEEDDDRLSERLMLVEELSAVIDRLLDAFISTLRV